MAVDVLKMTPFEDFYFNAVKSSNRIYNRDLISLDNSVIRKLRNIPVKKQYSDPNLIEEFWKDVLQNRFHLQTESLEEGEFKPFITTFKDISVTNWLPQFPGLKFTDFFLKQSQRYKQKIKLVDLHSPSLKNQNPNKSHLSLIKVNPNLAHSDVSDGIPFYMNKEEFPSASDIFNPSFKEKGSICLSKAKLYIEKLEISDDPNDNPLKTLQIRLIDYEIAKDGRIDHIQAFIGIQYYYQGEIKQIKEHFWIGVEDFEAHFQTARKRLRLHVPKNATIIMENETLNNSIFESGTTFGPLFDEFQISIMKCDFLALVDYNSQEITIKVKNEKEFTTKGFLGSFLVPMFYHSGNSTLDIRNITQEGDNYVQRIFLRTTDETNDSLNFWGFINFIIETTKLNKNE